jgi:hypothetical protein
MPKILVVEIAYVTHKTSGAILRMPVETRMQRSLRLQQETAKVDWQSLPPEILQMVFRNLDGETFVEAIPVVCKACGVEDCEP